MGLLYNATKWLDHVTQYPMRRRITSNSDGTSDVVRAEGEIIQQGTPRNAQNYNNMESGILANSIYNSFLVQWVLQLQRASGKSKVNMEQFLLSIQINTLLPLLQLLLQ